MFVSVFFFIYLGLSYFLQTICIFYKQFTNILAIFEDFLKSQNLTNPYFMGYLPQHCLYFLPLPHAPFLSIFSLYLVHIVLWLLALFYGHLVHIIISIICIINITNNLFNVDKMWTKSSYILSFVSKEIISYIDCLINVDRLFSVTLKVLWYFL